MRQPGVRPVLFVPKFNPTPLEWHFYAGINVSDCTPHQRPGDWNGAYTRMRMLTALRLLEEAASQGANDTELVLCVNESPINGGDWCLRGAQPVFAMTTNQAEGAPLIVFPHWMSKLRDYDFSVWDEARAALRAQRKRDAAAARSGPRPEAVFRGGLYRLNAYSDEWRTRGVKYTAVTANNWRTVGRSALVHAQSHPETKDLVNISIKPPRIVSEPGTWVSELRVPPGELRALARPVYMSQRDQEREFRYTINAEGHGGWADRLYQLLLSRQLVLGQDLPLRLWYEALTRHGVTHLALHSNLRPANLSATIRWAREHDAEVRAMVRAANQAMDAATSVGGIRLYVRELLSVYSGVLAFSPARHPRAIRFHCSCTADCRSCNKPSARHGKSGAIRTVCGESCAFVVGGQRFSTLHEASTSTAFRRNRDVLTETGTGPCAMMRKRSGVANATCRSRAGGHG